MVIIIDCWSACPASCPSPAHTVANLLAAEIPAYR